MTRLRWDDCDWSNLWQVIRSINKETSTSARFVLPFFQAQAKGTEKSTGSNRTRALHCKTVVIAAPAIAHRHIPFFLPQRESRPLSLLYHPLLASSPVSLNTNIPFSLKDLTTYIIILSFHQLTRPSNGA